MLTWGNTSAIIATLEKMVRREGLGNVLADGVQRAAERIGKGAEKYSVHIRSQEPDLHDPRFSPCRSLAYVADPTPGRHMTASASMRLDGERKLASCPELQAPRGLASTSEWAENVVWELATARPLMSGRVWRPTISSCPFKLPGHPQMVGWLGATSTLGS